MCAFGTYLTGTFVDVYGCVSSYSQHDNSIMCYVVFFCLFVSLYADLAALTHRDDEYAWAGVEDPKIVVTTSHNPSSRLKQFAKVIFFCVCDKMFVFVCN